MIFIKMKVACFVGTRYLLQQNNFGQLSSYSIKSLQLHSRRLASQHCLQLLGLSLDQSSGRGRPKPAIESLGRVGFVIRRIGSYDTSQEAIVNNGTAAAISRELLSVYLSSFKPNDFCLLRTRRYDQNGASGQCGISGEQSGVSGEQSASVYLNFERTKVVLAGHARFPKISR